MKLEKFNENYLNDVLTLLNNSLEHDKFNQELLIENVLSDPDYDSELTLISKEDDEVIGFVMGVIRDRETERMGYLKLIAVKPEKRRAGVGSKLYDLIEQKIKQISIEKIRLLESYPNYYMPGLDPFYTEAVCFFERKGFYRVGDTSNLEADLLNQNFSTNDEEAALYDQDVIIKRAGKDDFDKMIGWTDKNFKAWISEVKNSFENEPISIHIALHKDEIVAFSAYESNNKGTGWFGPMGTSEFTRGKGIGGILLKRCLNDLKNLGFENAIIPWVGPIPFYMHYCNSKVKRVFWRYEKKI